MNIANIYKIMIDTYIIWTFLSLNRVFFYVFNNNKTNAISRWSKSIAIKLCAISEMHAKV